MCGLAGYLSRKGVPPDYTLLEALFAPIRARGPDDEGLCFISRPAAQVRELHTPRSVARFRAVLPSYRDERAAVPHDLAILHTRYAVMDASDAAHQPWLDSAGDVVLAFQGEIFNYVELRRELESSGVRFRTASDTEVLAAAYRSWGYETWPRLNGFWAAAVFDVARRRFVLCRDRLGVAPLCLAQGSDRLYFGSSALGLAAALGSPPARGRVRGFIETGLKDFDEHTLFEGVRSLRPGTFLTFSADAASLSDATEERYWDAPTRRLTTRDLGLGEAATMLRETLASAVGYRLRGDLPVGFQLSGGLDSTAVTALASELTGAPLPTYTVSVPEQDEAPAARVIGARFGLNGTFLTDLWKGLPEDAVHFARLMEEPLQAPSAYAHHAMCWRMKQDGFGVTLSGSGGDEVLAGYEWDFWPEARKLLVAQGLHRDALWQEMVFRYGSWRRVRGRLGGWAERAGRWSRHLGRAGSVALERPVGAPANGDAPLDGIALAPAVLLRYESLDYDARRRHHLSVAHLPYYLASNDRATLGIPLEHRQPFLDHRMVELGLSMPPSYLFHKGWTKYVLRKAMEPLVPSQILWQRDKLGFPFPVRRVMREGRAVFAAAARRTAQEGFADQRPRYEELLERDPLRLWRACSVGLWLMARD
jgi:asparagine synthase (glutamine-hydrolysing)